MLREIEGYAEQGAGFERNILENFDPDLPTRQEAEELLVARQLDSPENAPAFPYVRVYKVDLVYNRYEGRHGYQERNIKLDNTLSNLEAFRNDPQAVQTSADQTSSIFYGFVSLFTIRLDGSTRLALTDPRPSGNVRSEPQNHLWALAQDEEARARLRKITYDAFGLYFAIDPTNMQTFHVSMSEIEPPPGIELFLGPEGREYFDQATDISQLSDGVKAFTGLSAAVQSSDFRIMLVDEPEAFLHPILARKLGRRLTELASARSGNVLAATHSPDFLMGCVEAGTVNVIRLTYQREVPSARILPASTLRQMMRDPLLRSTGVLSALFHEGAVVCEGDADRAFYQEINYRMLTSRSEESKGSDGTEVADEAQDSNKPMGADNSIFLHAHGKDPIPKIVKPLREMGIPAAALLDLDVLKNESNAFTRLLTAALVPEDLRYSWGNHRGRVDGKLRSKDSTYKTNSGIDLLDKSDRESAESLLDNLAQYGIFIVHRGELESWLKEWLETLNEKPTKSRWVPRVFELMGSDPKQPQYLKPQEGDVWAFMTKVAKWIADPNRKGMPE